MIRHRHADQPRAIGGGDRHVAQAGRPGSRPEARRILERKQPIGRLITVDEVVDAVWFCVVNGGVSGQGLNVDGGAVQG